MILLLLLANLESLCSYINLLLFLGLVSNCFCIIRVCGKLGRTIAINDIKS